MIKFTKEEAAFAAENYHMVFDFLEKEGLDSETYYDAVLSAFLVAVQEFFYSDYGVGCFKEKALSAMRTGKDLFERETCSDITVLSLECDKENGKNIEDTVAEVLDYAQSVIDDIAFEEVLEHFSDTEKRIARLLASGYEQESIAMLLGVNMQYVVNCICSMRTKLCGGLMAAA